MARSEHQTARGQLVTKVLAGSWRCSCSSHLNISESDLDEVTPLLYGSGGAALGWWRLRGTGLKTALSARMLQQAYWLQALQSVVHENKIEKIFRLFREASIDAILAKGWAAARLYPDTALRPYGDIDLCIRPEHLFKSKAVLASPDASDCRVDLHEVFSEIEDRTFNELFFRSRCVTLGLEEIRILGAEDHLALLSIHLLKHGAWRPLWLCDIGMAMESLSSQFDWDVCLGKSETRAGWIVCSILLAQQLLGAKIDALPKRQKAKAPPRWMVKNILRQWASPFAINQPPMSHPAPMASYLKNPKGLLKGLRKRWPNPIIATVSIKGRFNNFPRLPYQVGNWALRAAQFLSHMPTKVQSVR